MIPSTPIIHHILLIVPTNSMTPIILESLYVTLSDSNSRIVVIGVPSLSNIYLTSDYSKSTKYVDTYLFLL